MLTVVTTFTFKDKKNSDIKRLLGPKRLIIKPEEAIHLNCRVCASDFKSYLMLTICVPVDPYLFEPLWANNRNHFTWICANFG